MNLTFKRHLPIVSYGWFWLLTSCLGACQRASYPLPRAAATAYQLSPPAPIAASEATATITAARLRPINPPSKRRQVARLGARRSAAQAAGVRAETPPAPRPNLAGVARRVASRGQLQEEPSPGAAPLRHRSRGIAALLLAILSITYVPLSLHNFYLGYYGRGARAIALLVVGIYLLAIGFLGFLFGGVPAVLGYVRLFVLAGWLGWQITDLIAIIAGKLQPKNGEYNKRFL